MSQKTRANFGKLCISIGRAYTRHCAAKTATAVSKDLFKDLRQTSS